MIGWLLLAGMTGSLVAQPSQSATMSSAMKRNVSQAAPCHAVPSLCLSTRAERSPSLFDDSRHRVDMKMDAYRMDARPCRLVGNMDCPAKARRQIWRLGEPIRETLRRSFRLRSG